MKSALVLLCLAVFVAVAYGADSSCNPDGNNQPTCSGTDATPIRNFWDPTRYWVCNGGVAEAVECPIAQGFDPVSGACVDWGVWQWYAPCQ
ncbi:uncharacterized protein LOC115626115 [Scaptodrosophila lebanonensis]|uniref:Uncharacterized protein LOC115626115 n=1 Tax=Drosophila lebanonensis TaxID=7225 RepID=A0A6J2TNY2_DROLE|nr:uncharacterized protein LOC115626115 [Scaptodrosophila lebanonensis]